MRAIMATGRTFAFVLALAALVPRRADAVITVGADAGIVKQTADSPSNLKAGFGFGAHIEAYPVPVLAIGPYFLHYSLSSADWPAPNSVDATFNTLGVRARFILPIPGRFKPYAHAGLGYAIVDYNWPPAPDSGYYVDAPLGVGVAYEVVEIFQLSLDVSYRVALTHGGNPFDIVTGNEGGSGYVNSPTGGWSLLLGASFNL
jgi:Outer membrane protein beta-barrel domain